MTEAEAGKLPMHLQLQEERLTKALSNLRDAYELAIKVEEQLKDTLHNAKQLLDENNS